MSAAIAEPIVPSPKTLTLVPPAIAPEPKGASADRYPLIPVFVAGVIAMTGALLFVGWILAWLALRHSGINATW